MKQKLLIISTIFCLLGVSLPDTPAQAQLSLVRPITFPVVGFTSYSDDFLDARSGGRVHEGNDIFGKKMQLLVAAVDGVVTNVNYPEATWGYSVTIRDNDGYRYLYIHMNNDTPGTDDGHGDGMNAYAPNIAEGNKVVKGQIIGFMGDSGNAETTPPHLHFEIHAPGGDPMNPYLSLQQATKITTPVASPKLDNEILPFGDFAGGGTVAAGNLDSDTNSELVVGAGPGGGPLVRTFEQDGTAIGAFYAYAEIFRGGVDVAAADVDGDGKAEIITAPGFGGGPHIKIFKADGTLLKQFFAYDSRFHGGVNISAADLNNDNKAEIITAPGKGGGPHVKVLSLDGVSVKEFMAYDPGFHGGVDVAAAQNGNAAVIATTPGPGGGPHVKLFDGSGVMTKEFFAYDGKFTVGLRVTLGNIRTGSSAPEVAVLPATAAGPHLKTFSLDGTELDSEFAGFEEWWRSGYDLAAISSDIYIVSGAGRRVSVRSANDFSNQNK
jgi:hypothetical protein